MITSNEVDKVLPALFQLKKKLKPMTKDSKNPFFKSNYLELPDLLDNLEPLVEECGLVISQATCHRHGDEYVISRLSHAESGQFVEAEYKVGFVDDPQKNGARNTYGRRFSLKGLIGLSERDDDGNFASGKASNAKPADKPTASKPADKPVSGFGSSPAKEPAKLEGASAPKPSSGFGSAQPASQPAKVPARSGSFGQ
jgi:hypothetical protein